MLGRFFGVRYFLNLQITCSFKYVLPMCLLFCSKLTLSTSSKHLKVQLPITIIHPVSLTLLLHSKSMPHSKHPIQKLTVILELR